MPSDHGIIRGIWVQRQFLAQFYDGILFTQLLEIAKQSCSSSFSYKVCQIGWECAILIWRYMWTHSGKSSTAWMDWFGSWAGKGWQVHKQRHIVAAVFPFLCLQLLVCADSSNYGEAEMTWQHANKIINLKLFSLFNGRIRQGNLNKTDLMFLGWGREGCGWGGNGKKGRGICCTVRFTLMLHFPAVKSNLLLSRSQHSITAC